MEVGLVVKIAEPFNYLQIKKIDIAVLVFSRQFPGLHWLEVLTITGHLQQDDLNDIGKIT